MKKQYKKLYILLTIFFLFIFINLFSFISIKIVTKKNIYTKEYIEFKKRFRKSEFKSMYPHPFFGFGVKDNFYSEKSLNNEPLFVNNLQTIDETSKIKILILGGSVAKHLSLNNSDDVIEFNGKKISKTNIFQETINSFYSTNRFQIYNASIDGGKQPQQLFKLYYLNLVDHKFDVIINLDGFNEIALTLSENYLINDHLIYPRNYSRLISTFNSNFECVRNLNKRVNRYLYLPLLELYDLYFIRKCHFTLEGQNINSGTRFSEITNYQKIKFEEALKISKKIWKLSSEKIYDFSKQNKNLYIHVIQPNLYLKNSKILTNNERKLLSYPKYGDIISKYYDGLSILDLKIENGLDLRYFFKNNNKDLYRDYCCHLNNLGMHLISLEIIKTFDVKFNNLLID